MASMMEASEDSGLPPYRTDSGYASIKHNAAGAADTTSAADCDVNAVAAEAPLSSVLLSESPIAAPRANDPDADDCRAPSNRSEGAPSELGVPLKKADEPPADKPKKRKKRSESKNKSQSQSQRCVTGHAFDPANKGVSAANEEINAVPQASRHAAERRPVSNHRFDPTEAPHMRGSTDPIEEHIEDIRLWLRRMRKSANVTREDEERPPRRRSTVKRRKSAKKRAVPEQTLSSTTVTTARTPQRSVQDVTSSTQHSGGGDVSRAAAAGVQFVSFLDGKTFNTPEELCDYNTAVAQSLSDGHLAIIRSRVFNMDEMYFAELLYGDTIAEELRELSSSAERSPMAPQLLMEMRQTAVNRFNAKCTAAHTALLTFGGDVNDAIQREGIRVLASRAIEVSGAK